ncbi:hypothetical protein [Bradyrhizobium sp. 21]|uniref:HalD/BesD family halogenase n=1 Tax=Bradyrhizobium sp. 21 TaxID=2782666 RepID=UPI001FF7534E|nr:hypothetical protein [Bradyrhizobium sp. 21]MCK1387662.1 hypothetical protein [Bradyrhizobium sp. 21]
MVQIVGDDRPLELVDLDTVTTRYLETQGPSAANYISARNQFQREGFAVVTSFIPPAFVGAVEREARVLLDAGAIRRDFRMKATDDTPRRMRNVRQAEIKRRGKVVPALYECAALRAMLGEIAGEPLFTCPFDDEQYVITCLEQPGDTHGWHWDDYSFALVWVIQAPPVELGGFVQCVGNTVWNKSNPRVAAALAGGVTRSYPVGSGQVYLMRTDITLHRVYPLLQPTVRIIANMAWASTRNLAQTISHETVDALWSATDEQARGAE